MANLLVGLSIRHLGTNGSQVLARAMGHMDRVIDAPEEEIAGVEGIGQVIAASIKRFFSLPRNREVVERRAPPGSTSKDRALPLPLKPWRANQ